VKRVLVTGGSGAIGSAIAARLGAEGLKVHVHAHQGVARAEAVATRIRDAGGQADVVRFDVCDSEASRRAIEDLLAEGPIQVLIHNAGTHADAPLAGMSRDQWQGVIDVALMGFYNCARPLLLPMIAERWGRIVNITSVAALAGNRGQTNYAAAKAGLHGATKALAIELASRGVTVNAVAPGIIAGGMGADAFDRETIRRLVPMGRAGRPEEVADLVAYLVCGDSGYLSGQIISLNGGML
jgi:3-oxoacyl-[acyl-carrier protein] reductase